MVRHWSRTWPLLAAAAGRSHAWAAAPRQPCRERPDAWWCGEGRLVGELAYRDGWALAVNAEHRLVATILSPYAARDAGLLKHHGGTAYPLLCIVCALDACQLTEHGLLTPAAQRLLEHRRQRERAVDHPPPRVTAPATAPVRAALPKPPPDTRQAEYLRRAEGLTPQQRLALIKEMFLPRERP